MAYADKKVVDADANAARVEKPNNFAKQGECGVAEAEAFSGVMHLNEVAEAEPRLYLCLISIFF
jgi:hypothetical protein